MANLNEQLSSYPTNYSWTNDDEKTNVSTLYGKHFDIEGE